MDSIQPFLQTSIYGGHHVTGVTDEGPSQSLWGNCPIDIQDPHKGFGFFYNFTHVDQLDDNFTKTTGAGGTNLSVDVVGGSVQIVTAGTDNDYMSMVTPGEIFKFATGKEVWFEVRFKLAEATTNESAIAFGFTDTLTTGGMQADALGPLASYNGALIWKDEATMTTDFEVSNAATQATADASLATFVTDTWTKWGMHFDGVETMTPYIDGVAIVSQKQTVTLTGLAEMHAIMFVKAGGTAEAESLEIDWIACYQRA